MSEWTPKPKRDAATEDLNLTGEEGFVLSRVDGATSLNVLVQVTGLPEGRVKQILRKLVAQGAVEADAAPAPVAAPTTRAPSMAPKPRKERVISEEELAALLDSDEGEALGPEHPTLDDASPVPLEPTEELEPVQLPEKAVSAPDEVQLEADAPAADTSATETADDSGATDDEQQEQKEAGGEEDVEEGNYRKLYETQLSKLEPPQREAMARTAEDPELMALCFDPIHSTIRGIFENAKSGPSHARLVARHHRTPQGLDVVMGRAEFLRDPQIQRLLLANPMLQDAQLKKLLQSKRLMDVYKATINREIPEKNRQKARQIMRTKYATAEGEERAALIIQTEGRVLTQLTGLPFDSQMTSILCGKTINSVLFIQNLARFGATPPQLLAQMWKSPQVRRQQHLKNLILQHPNCPAECKRMQK
jgi:hypothetical protein